MTDTNDMRREFEAWEINQRDQTGFWPSSFDAYQAATERATQLEPVAVIDGINAYGPRIGWLTHWVKVGVGTKLYAAPPPAIRQGDTT